MRKIFYLFISMLFLSYGFAVCNTIEEKRVDKKTEEYFEAIKLLDIAYELAYKIKNEEVKNSVLGELGTCKECLYLLFNRKDFAEMAEKALFLHENMGEILADCDDQDNLKIAIEACIADMAEQFSDY